MLLNENVLHMSEITELFACHKFKCVIIDEICFAQREGKQESAVERKMT